MVDFLVKYPRLGRLFDLLLPLLATLAALGVGAIMLQLLGANPFMAYSALLKGAFGALLFGATKALATLLQRAFPEVSVVAFNALPWLLMILVLLAVGSDYTERFITAMPHSWQRPLRRVLRVSPPMALGTAFHEG